MFDEKLFKESQRLFEMNAFAIHNHMYLIKMEEGYAECGIKLHDDSKNPYGMAHGGTYYSLADMTTGAVARSDGRRHVTLNASCSYLRAAQEGELICKARCIHAGKKTTLCEAKVYDDKGTLCFTGQFTYFCIAEKGEPLPYNTKQAQILNRIAEDESGLNEND